ncbi:MAG: glycosyltransferase [Candidatus Nitrosopumilus sp. bin_7KS]
MRILQVISQLSDFMGDSGQVLHFAEYYKKKGHDVTIVTTDGDPFFDNPENSKRYEITRNKFLENQEKKIEINGISVIPIHCKFPKLGMYSPKATKFAKKIIDDFDVVHVYSWYHHIGLVFAKQAILLKKPVFVSFWGTLQPEAQKYHKLFKSMVDFLYTKKIIHNATGLHSIGISETEIYLKLGAEKSKIYEIDNGVVLSDFESKSKSTIFEKLDVDKSKKIFLYLGRIHEKKGIELFLKAIKKLEKTNDQFEIIIAGSGEEKYVSKIKSIVKELKLETFVKFTGFVSHDDKLELLKNSTIFVLTSFSDIHPRAVQEALTMGLPVLITENCDYPEVEEYECGKIVQANINSIYNGINEILDGIEKKEFSKNAKKLILDKFQMEVQIKKFETMYQNFIRS